MDEIKPFMEPLLGLKDPWTLTRIEADLEAAQVDLYVVFLPGSRWPCPECGNVGCPVHGVKQVKVPWSREGSGFSLLNESLAMSLVKFMPVRETVLIQDECYTPIWRNHRTCPV